MKAKKERNNEQIGTLFMCRSCNHEWFDLAGRCPQCKSPLVKTISQSIPEGYADAIRISV